MAPRCSICNAEWSCCPLPGYGVGSAWGPSHPERPLERPKTESGERVRATIRRERHWVFEAAWREEVWIKFRILVTSSMHACGQHGIKSREEEEDWAGPGLSRSRWEDQDTGLGGRKHLRFKWGWKPSHRPSTPTHSGDRLDSHRPPKGSISANPPAPEPLTWRVSSPRSPRGIADSRRLSMSQGLGAWRPQPQPCASQPHMRPQEASGGQARTLASQVTPRIS